MADPGARTTAFTVEPAAYDDEVSLLLVAELDADLERRYRDGNAVVADPEQFLPERGGVFLVARDAAGEPAGCAGVRALPDHPGAAELKRMWVREGFRRRGLARQLLAATEDAARALSHRELWLETGTQQPEALELYRSAGYAPVARFGQFAAMPDAVHLGRALPAAPPASSGTVARHGGR